MQISRHWRLNAQRYRLEGFRNSNGEVSLQARQVIKNEVETAENQNAPAMMHNNNTRRAVASPAA